MNILKAFTTVLLGLLLFVCLTLLGPGIAVNATLLNSGFINSHIDRLDINGIAEEIVFPEMRDVPELASHPETIASIENTLKEHEAEIKETVKYVIDDVYGYVIGGHEIDLIQTLENSILKPELAISILNDLDLTLFVEDWIADMIPADLPLHIELTPYVDELVPVLQPWLKQEAGLLIPDVYDYLLGKSQNLEISFPLDSVKDDIHDALKAAFLKSPPLEYATQSQSELSQLFDSNWDEVSDQIPQTLEIDENAFTGLPGELATAIDEAEEALRQAKLYAGYYQAGLWALAGLAVIIILGIFLVNRKITFSSAALGTVFAGYGIISIIGTLVAKSIVQTQLALQAEIPAALGPWLAQLSDSLFNPLIIFSIICIVTGIGWFVLAFIFRQRAASS